MTETYIRDLLRRAALPVVAALSLSAAYPAAAQSNPNILVVAVPGDIQNFDPTLSGGDIPTQEMLANVYDYLIDFKPTKHPDGSVTVDPNEFIGNLAESFAWSEDKKTLTLHLRAGLKFANGDPLDAEAVKFTYDRIFDQNEVTAALSAMASVTDKNHVTVVDPLTVQIAVDTPNTLLFGNMAQFGHSILNPKVVKPNMTAEDPYAHEWLKNNTQGNEAGPYTLAAHTPGDGWVLQRNPNYWGEPAKTERVIFKIIPDASSRLAQLLSGSVDIAYDIPTSELKALSSNPDITVNADTSMTAGYIGMNNAVPPFDNKLVRQAVSYAFPYETMIEQVMNGYSTQLTSPVPAGMPTHTDEFFVYKNDPVKAKELLAEAGFPDGFSTTMQIPAGSQQAKEAAVYTQEALGKVGIQVTIEELPGANYVERLQKHTLVFFWNLGWTSINNDPYYHLFWNFNSNCCNFTNYKNEAVSAIIDKFMLSTDATARDAGSVEAQKLIIDDAPWILRDQPDRIVVTRSNVKGYVFLASDQMLRFKYFYKE